MNINLHIDRLVLDGLPIEHQDGPLVKAAVEAELSRLLTANGLANSLMAGGAMPSTPAPGLQMSSDSSPARLGQKIGRAIYGGIGKPT
jgi:hypothetical protein